MFFQIKKEEDPSFTTRIKITDQYWLNADAGWCVFELTDYKVIFKGYIDLHAATEDVIAQIIASPLQLFTGNYVAIITDSTNVRIASDVQRGAPLYYADGTIFNIGNTSTASRIPASQSVTLLENGDIERVISTPLFATEFATASKTDVVDQIDNILTQRFTNFFKHNVLPVKWFSSAGVDTTLVWSYLIKLGIAHTAYFTEHYDKSTFYLNHATEITTNWGYTQMHCWEEPSVLASGVWGDEIMLRAPRTAAQIAKMHGVNLIDITLPIHSHYSYFNYTWNNKYFVNVASRTLSEVLNEIYNDHQHWHLDNTLTFTPLKDIEITKLLCKLPVTDMLSQMTDSTISKELIHRNCSRLVALMQPQKNTTVDYSKFTSFCDEIQQPYYI